MLVFTLLLPWAWVGLCGGGGVTRFPVPFSNYSLAPETSHMLSERTGRKKNGKRARGPPHTLF